MDRARLQLLVRRGLCGSAALLGAAFALPGSAVAQDASQPSLSFQAALARLEKASPRLSGEDHAVRASEDIAAATRTLRRPIVTASASVIEYQKTLSVDLSDPKAQALDATNGFLDQLGGQFSGEAAQIVEQATQRISAALPRLFGAIPDSLEFQTRETVFRPAITAAMPLYTGGAIPAVQKGADAAVGIARAKQAGGQDLARVNLVRAYFGQKVAAQLTRSTRDQLEAFDRHLSDARTLEANGVLAHARVLEVEVARNTAQRAHEHARSDEAIATDTLARLLDQPAGIIASTPLFVQSEPLPPLQRFLDGLDQSPRAQGADAARNAAQAGVDLARSRYRPQAFAFGSYNANRNNALPTEPDWIAGVSLRITLLSNFDRQKALSAARENEAAAADAAAQARRDVAGEIVRAWHIAEAARRSFLLLDANLAAAQENLRVQQLSFREGEVASSALIDAEAALATVQTQRLAAAYEYDLGLMALLAASHRVEDYSAFMTRADRHVEDQR